MWVYNNTSYPSLFVNDKTCCLATFTLQHFTHWLMLIWYVHVMCNMNMSFYSHQIQKRRNFDDISKKAVPLTHWHLSSSDYTRNRIVHWNPPTISKVTSVVKEPVVGIAIIAILTNNPLGLLEEQVGVPALALLPIRLHHLAPTLHTI